MALEIDPSRFHRLAKLYMDTGEANSYEEAKRILSRNRLAIAVGPQIADSATLQASLLTAVNTGRRCFLGGVEVSGPLDVPLRLAWPRAGTLADIVAELQGERVENLTPEIPRILIGSVPRQERTGQFCVRAMCDGWRGGVLPQDHPRSLPLNSEFTPSGVLTGAMAVSEAFQHVRGESVYAGRRVIGLSLWEPERSEAWLDCQAGPQVRVLPAKIWLIGLGHLGQAYLWTLGFLPYAHPEDVDLVLQDVDCLSESNDSTSLLSTLKIVGTKKTRAMASWCDAMGFQARIIEREFCGNFRIADDEPRVALCGVDNPQARATLENVGFERVLEAGLGAGVKDFLCFQTHSFPANRKALDIWGNGKELATKIKQTLSRPAYQALANDGVEHCGLTQLAGCSVGSSFVGAVTSTLVVADLIRMSMGENQYEVIDADLMTGKIRVIQNNMHLPAYNPGLTEACRQV